MTSAVEQRCEARIGQVLKGKWTLERVLGIGGMAAVYVAQHKIGRREAIKILHPEVARDQEQRKRFEQEARAANQLVHPGIVEVRDIDVTDDGCPFMVMELLEGETLGDLANRKGGLAVEETLTYVEEILDVLALAHTSGIVHRDIKLGNLFLTREGRIKVLDFGIARLASSQLTRVGARLGTAAYMPPEQVRGEPVDGRADLYAVGATMFRVLAKRRIHEAPTEAQMIVKTATEPAPLLATVCDAPGPVCLIVDRALAFAADERYPDARTMQADVQAVRRGEAPPHASSPSAAAVARAGATRAEGIGRGRPGRAGPGSMEGPPSGMLAAGQAPAAHASGAEAFEATGYAMEAAPPSVQVRVGGLVDAHEATGFGGGAGAHEATGLGPAVGAVPGGAASAGPTSSRDYLPTVVPPRAGAPSQPPGSMATLSEPFPVSGRVVGASATTPTPPVAEAPPGDHASGPPSVGAGDPPPSNVAAPMATAQHGAPASVRAVPTPLGVGTAPPGGASVSLATQDQAAAEGSTWAVPTPSGGERSGPIPRALLLAGVGGVALLALTIVLLVLFGGNEGAAVEGAASAPGATASGEPPMLGVVPVASGVVPRAAEPAERSRTTTPRTIIMKPAANQGAQSDPGEPGKGKGKKPR